MTVLKFVSVVFLISGTEAFWCTDRSRSRRGRYTCSHSSARCRFRDAIGATCIRDCHFLRRRLPPLCQKDTRISASECFSSRRFQCSMLSRCRVRWCSRGGSTEAACFFLIGPPSMRLPSFAIRKGSVSSDRF